MSCSPRRRIGSPAVVNVDGGGWGTARTVRQFSSLAKSQLVGSFSSPGTGCAGAGAVLRNQTESISSKIGVVSDVSGGTAGVGAAGSLGAAGWFHPLPRGLPVGST